SETKPGEGAAIGGIADTPALAARVKHIRDDRACAELLVERDLPRHPLRANQTDGRFDAYRQAQARLVKSPAVLKAALAGGGLAGLAVFRDRPDALEFLDSHIEAHVPAEEPFIIVSFDGPRTRDTAAVVNAVAQALVNESANIESAAYKNRARPLEK